MAFSLLACQWSGPIAGAAIRAVREVKITDITILSGRTPAVTAARRPRHSTATAHLSHCIRAAMRRKKLSAAAAAAIAPPPLGGGGARSARAGCALSASARRRSASVACSSPCRPPRQHSSTPRPDAAQRQARRGTRPLACTVGRVAHRRV